MALRIATLAAAAVAACSTPLTILPLGDSITHGVGSRAQPPHYAAPETPLDGGYRAPLYHALVYNDVPATAFQFVGTLSSGPADIPVAQRAHEGHPGYTIAQVLALSQNWGPLMADVVLVHLGTNE